MALHKFTKQEKTDQDYINEIYKAAGCSKFPLTVTVNNGKLIGVIFDTEWKEGSTSPVKNNRGQIIKNKENYSNNSLNKDQIKKVEKYISDNIST